MLALGTLATLDRKASRFADVERGHLESLPIFRDVHDRAADGLQPCGWGLLLADTGRVEEAREVWRRGYRSCVRSGVGGRWIRRWRR